jgi:hypothetical protein
MYPVVSLSRASNRPRGSRCLLGQLSSASRGTPDAAYHRCPCTARWLNGHRELPSHSNDQPRRATSLSPERILLDITSPGRQRLLACPGWSGCGRCTTGRWQSATEHPTRISPRALGGHLAQSLPQCLGVPRRVPDEVLKRFIRAGIAQARPHRLHRLAATVVEQAGDVATQRAPLTRSAEAAFEWLQPRQQPAQPRRCGAIDHCGAAY